MNYIQQLREENARLQKRVEYLEGAMTHFHAFLHTDKFSGTQTDGERKDWIATGDVIHWIQDVRSSSLTI